jgi:hypothetical protein
MMPLAAILFSLKIEELFFLIEFINCKTAKHKDNQSVK